jgi:tRNA U34 5-carboxymethylaminomethyl modifying enzyme MnmG/GidA
VQALFASFSKRFLLPNAIIFDNLDGMRLETIRKKLSALKPEQRRLLAHVTGVGIATIYRIANEGYMPSTRIVEKIKCGLK